VNTLFKVLRRVKVVSFVDFLYVFIREWVPLTPLDSDVEEWGTTAQVDGQFSPALAVAEVH
jgi:hypothetical protein